MSFYRAKPRKGLRRRPFLGAPSPLSPDRTGGQVISKLEEKDTYDVGGAKSDGHGGATSSCQKQASYSLPQPFYWFGEKSPTRRAKGKAAPMNRILSSVQVACRIGVDFLLFAARLRGRAIDSTGLRIDRLGS